MSLEKSAAERSGRASSGITNNRTLFCGNGTPLKDFKQGDDKILVFIWFCYFYFRSLWLLCGLLMGE